jgi:hypothetical protein
VEGSLDGPDGASNALGQALMRRADQTAVASVRAQGQQYVAVGSGQVSGAPFAPDTIGPVFGQSSSVPRSGRGRAGAGARTSSPVASFGLRSGGDSGKLMLFRHSVSRFSRMIVARPKGGLRHFWVLGYANPFGVKAASSSGMPTRADSSRSVESQGDTSRACGSG